MIDLTRYQTRVNAAVTTGQCLDYAEDVSALVSEVQRLTAGIEAAEEFYMTLHRLATHIPSWTAQTPQTVGRDAALAERMLRYMYQAMQ